MLSVTRDCDTVLLDSYNPPVSFRLSVEEAAKLRDCIESAIMDYDAQQQEEAHPQADNSAMVPCPRCLPDKQCDLGFGGACGIEPCQLAQHQ